MTRITYHLRPDGNGGWEGEILVPSTTADGLKFISGKATGSTKKAALGGAAGKLIDGLDNPLVKGLIPPQAQLAIQGVKMLSKAPGAKTALRIAKGIGGKRLARVFGF